MGSAKRIATMTAVPYTWYGKKNNSRATVKEDRALGKNWYSKIFSQCLPFIQYPKQVILNIHIVDQDMHP
ncbi:hypothetical protein CDL12_14839 [Handroanthus impetiginosus]|uniref:Uncharacterized protein n=1 Tax=Handroanthus impetiginosus TaxID=429701 RepID=A0A2G9H5F4_9LAMI|nr:hypothetical protein CDL12_14839 [Handroanthus impetiginosus]